MLKKTGKHDEESLKHLIKISSYPENEAIIYCPNRNEFSFIKLEFPLKCPRCGQLVKNDGKSGKIVLNYPTPLE
jgi:hypothetical protein